MTARPLPPDFYAGEAHEVAPLLLNKVLEHGGSSGRIVEVEAYDGATDPASHAYRGETARNAVMFGPPGHLYVYFSYGMHYCCNVVCGPDGRAAAVLIRALEPMNGIEEMRGRRNQLTGRVTNLASGPGKLCQALAISRDQNGADLFSGDRGIRVLDDGVPPPDLPACGPRVGISAGIETPWRWWVEGNGNVSKRR